MKKIAILTSGGDAPGMNACIRACVRTAINSGCEIYGADRGYAGLVKNNIFKMNTRSVCDIIQRGGTILKTARCLEFKDPAVREIAANNLKNLGVDGLIVIGGDGSFTGAKYLSNQTGINVVGIPGTIDNDLAYTDFTLGFDSAVNTVLWAINNLRDTMTSHDRVSLVKVMGRHCGDIALYASICGGAEFVLVPEVEYDLNDINEKIKDCMERGKTSIVLILAEGAGDENEIKDSIVKATGADVKLTVLGHIQRGGSPTMQDRLLAARFGERAVNLLIEGKTNRVVGIRDNKIIDEDITEALARPRVFNKELYELSGKLN